MAFLKLLRKQIEEGTGSACFGVNAIAHQKQQGFDDDVLLGILTALVVVGSESTDSMMQSFIKIMALHPEVQQKAQEGINKSPSLKHHQITEHFHYRTRPSRRIFSAANLGGPAQSSIHQGPHKGASQIQSHFHLFISTHDHRGV